jgi:diguanylate cyclase (GGDEF)-like protein
MHDVPAGTFPRIPRVPDPSSPSLLTLSDNHCKRMKSLLTPGVFLVTTAILLHTGMVTPSAALIGYAFYGAWIAGLLLAWRFHSSRILFALLVLFFSQQAISFFSSGRISAHGPGALALAAIGVLLPIDFVLLSLHKEKGLTFPTIAPPALLLFIESVIVAVLCRPGPLTAAPRPHHVLSPAPLPLATLVTFAAAATLLLIRFALYRKPTESGMFWALAACFLALRFGGGGRIPAGYFGAAAFILAGAIVEASYLLAYQDELTGLPSRRAFHEGLLQLQGTYSIAMVDIDHFKRCNDTYGHDTGDQVLRLVAGRLARVTGGGRAYRCGGEEFAVVFTGKATSEVMPHLEELRASIESGSFRLRGVDRRQETRGPDRREAAKPVRSGGKATRTLANPAAMKTELSVTASIGVATSSKRNSTPEEVIKAADRALYRAKAGGRNRIETDSTKPRRARSKTAGIA